MARAYCPHCLLVLADEVRMPFPPGPVRCRHCQLLVGPGRAREQPDEEQRGRGSAAGVYASAARHSDEQPDSKEFVTHAIQHVAEEQGCAVERLLMLDYQRHAEREPELPPLGRVLATFGSWKSARRAAASRTPQESSA